MAPSGLQREAQSFAAAIERRHVGRALTSPATINPPITARACGRGCCSHADARSITPFQVSRTAQLLGDRLIKITVRKDQLKQPTAHPV
jgi:hypothetical protein